ncbi:hypothetical protein BH10PSE16_BH10PSE16_01190 [soil metagenome]
MDGRTFFQFLLDSRKLNPTSLSLKIEKPTLQSTLQRYLEGKTKEARRSTFEPVAEFFNVSIDAFYNPVTAEEELKRLHLIPGESSARGSKNEKQEVAETKDEPTQPHTEEAVSVRLLANSGSMGTGCDTLPDDVLVGKISLSPEWVRGRIRPSSVEALRFIHAYGDSMCPTFADGDVLLVDTGATDPSRADGVYVLSTPARVFIKRVTSRFDGGFDVSSDNPAVKVVSSLNGDHAVNVLGRVVWVWNGKRL